MNLIVKSKMRAFLLEAAKQTRAHKFDRVSKATFDSLEARLRAMALEHVRRLPSKGKTI